MISDHLQTNEDDADVIDVCFSLLDVATVPDDKHLISINLSGVSRFLKLEG